MMSPPRAPLDRKRGRFATYILGRPWVIIGASGDGVRMPAAAATRPGEASMYPRARFDTMSDGIFAVAMTLLVLDLRLPEDFHPHTSRELLDGLFELTPKFIPYVLSFLVLGLRWLSSVQVHTKAEHLGRDYFKWWLFYLLLVTCVPFSTLVVGRYPNLAPAIWVYAGNTALIALVSLGLLAATPQLQHDDRLRDRRVSIGFLLVSSLLAIAWSFISPRQALLFLVLNAAAPAAARWLGRGRSNHEAA
jgi:uncharacterized membrane protein